MVTGSKHGLHVVVSSLDVRACVCLLIMINLIINQFRVYMFTLYDERLLIGLVLLLPTYTKPFSNTYLTENLRLF